MDEMDIKETWKAHKDLQRARRAKRLPVRTDEILGLSKHGFSVVKLTDFQFRVEGKVDLYPIHNRFHNIKTGKRGGYKTPLELVRRELEMSKNSEPKP